MALSSKRWIGILRFGFHVSATTPGRNAAGRRCWVGGLFAAVLVAASGWAAEPETADIADVAPQALVGSALRISFGAMSEVNSDVAYDSINDRFLVVWQLGPPPDSGIGAALLNSDGTYYIAPFLIYYNYTNSLRPSVAFASAGNYLVAWEDDATGGRDILGVLLSTEGTFVTGYNLSRSSLATQAAPAVAAISSSDFLVVWEDQRDGNIELYAQAVLAGNLQTPNQRLTSNTRPDQAAALASARNGFNILMWQRNNGTVSVPNWDIYAGVVSNNGLPLGNEALFSGDLFQEQAPAIAFDPEHTRFLCAWEYGWSTLEIDVVGVLLNANFSNFTFTVTPLLIHDSWERNLEPAVAYDTVNDQFMVVWERDVGNTGDWDILGRYVSAAGAIGALENVAPTIGSSQLLPSVAYGGTRDQFLTVWHDNRAGQIDIWGQRTEFIPVVITVTAPNGGEQWAPATDRTITWTSDAGAGSTVRIDLERGGAFLSQIAASTDNDGAFVWSIPAAQTEATNYRVRVTAEGTSITDTSDADFSIITVSQALRLTAPNGGESWQVGTAHTISWTGNSCASVRLELWKGGAFHSLIIDSTANDGGHSWAIPSGQTVGNDYRVRVICTTNASNLDESDANFSIVSTGGPTISVTMPNGGESWTRGSTHSIAWTSSGGVGSLVNIDLYKGGALDSAIALSTANDGQYDWPIPSGQATGSDYRVRVSDAAAPSVFDESDGNFSIASGGTVTPPTMVAPNGGEVWMAGTGQLIRWSPGSAGASVKIELYRGLALDQVIAASVTNIGSFGWLIPGTQTPAGNYRVRVTSLSNPSLTDASDGYFTIIGSGGGTLRVVSPNGGETWRAGETRTVGWTPDSSTAVGIQLLKGGAFNLEITASTTNDGTFAWPIPQAQAPASDYRIRVFSTSNPSSEDTSDGDFIIAPPGRPNLTVEGLDFNPQDLSGGSPISLSGRIVNRGEATANVDFWIEFRASQSVHFTEPLYFVCDSALILAPLRPGESFDISTLTRTVYTPAQGLAAGAYFFGVVVDALNQVTESNENDNRGWMSQKQLYLGPRPTAAVNWLLYR